MGDILQLSVQTNGTSFFVVCPYELDAPGLGPYPTRADAARAHDEIFASVTGNCA